MYRASLFHHRNRPCKNLKLVHKDFPHHNPTDEVTIIQNVVVTHEIEEEKKDEVDTVVTNVQGEKRDNKKIPQKPKVIPYKATEENIGKLEEWLLTTFADVFDIDQCPLPVMSGPPQHIHVKENCTPYHGRPRCQNREC